MQGADDLSLKIGGRLLSGWTSVRVTRGIERCPSDFDIEMTDLYPGEPTVAVLKPGDQCEVYLGKVKVITGYVDRITPAIDRNTHTISVQGRGKCADLVDCAAEWPGSQIAGSNVLEIAQKLALPYGQPHNAINVTSDVDTGIRFPTFNLMLGETAYDIIERLCRYVALLAYDLPDGNLFLTRVGNKEMASGITQGVNVQSAAITYSMDQRFSQIDAYIQAFDTFLDLGVQGNFITTERDPNVPRHRRRVVIAEAGDTNFDIAKKRAQWEVARRLGRGQQLRVTVDSWRDAAGALWEPNSFVQLGLPALKLDNAKWVISEVTYRRDIASGTAADLIIMPKEAFIPQPIVIAPSLAELSYRQ